MTSIGRMTIYDGEYNPFEEASDEFKDDFWVNSDDEDDKELIKVRKVKKQMHEELQKDMEIRRDKDATNGEGPRTKL